MQQKKVTAQVTIVPLTDEQKKWGLKGALEAVDLILKTDRSLAEIRKLKNSLSLQLEQVESRIAGSK